MTQKLSALLTASLILALTFFGAARAFSMTQFLGSRNILQKNCMPRSQALERLSALRQSILSSKQSIDDKLASLELVDLLSEHVGRKYDGECDTFIRIAMELLKMEGSPSRRTYSSCFEFLTNLEKVLAEVREKTEDPFELALKYVEFAGVSNPLPVSEFAKNREYFNSGTFQAASSVSADELGLFVEARLFIPTVEKAPTNETESNQSGESYHINYYSENTKKLERTLGEFEFGTYEPYNEPKTSPTE